jgi:hypothetical protein
MPTVVRERPYRPVPLEPPRKKWARKDCTELEASGLCEGQHLELVDGELINKMARTGACQYSDICLSVTLRVFGEQHVNQEAPIDVAPGDNRINEPESRSGNTGTRIRSRKIFAWWLSRRAPARSPRRSPPSAWATHFPPRLEPSGPAAAKCFAWPGDSGLESVHRYLGHETEDGRRHVLNASSR